MSFEYIKETYGVPAEAGQRIRYTGEKGKIRDGVIIGYHGAYLRVKMDNEHGEYGVVLHPTWEIEYLND